MAKQKQELLMGGVNMIPRNRTMSMQSIPLDSVIPEPEVQKTTEDIDAENFLGSLVGQGFAMLGAGVAGRDPGRVADQFSDMRLYSDRQKESQKQREEAIKQSQDLMNPQSEISKRQRTLYSRFLGNIPEDVSASDLKDPVILRGLQEQQMKLQALKGEGVRQPAQPKPEKEVKSDKKLLEEYSQHTEALQSNIDTLKAINNLNRTRIGKYTPDYSTSTLVEAGEIERQAVPQVKVLAGPGALTDSDFVRLTPLVPNSNMTKELASETLKRNTISGMKKALAKLRTHTQVGLINQNDANKLIAEYKTYLEDPKLGINKTINDQGELVDLVQFKEE